MSRGVSSSHREGDLGVSLGHDVFCCRLCLKTDRAARGLCGTSFGEAMLRSAVAVGQVDLTHLT